MTFRFSNPGWFALNRANPNLGCYNSTPLKEGFVLETLFPKLQLIIILCFLNIHVIVYLCSLGLESLMTRSYTSIHPDPLPTKTLFLSFNGSVMIALSQHFTRCKFAISKFILLT
jgi:hypothetical protein